MQFLDIGVLHTHRRQTQSRHTDMIRTYIDIFYYYYLLLNYPSQDLHAV